MNARQEQAIEALRENGFPREVAAIEADPCEDAVRTAERTVQRFEPASLGEALTKTRAANAIQQIRTAFELHS